MVPLGYNTKDRKISVNEPEAELVHTIFRRYLNLGSINLLVADLRKSGLVTKARTLRTGGTVGGIPVTNRKSSQRANVFRSCPNTGYW